VDYYTGEFAGSPARGQPFGRNDKTGDVRISGTLASLVGLEAAIARDDKQQIQQAIDQILLLHSLIMSFGGIPLLYYGDEIGTLNSYDYREDPGRRGDNRWMHRPSFDWSAMERRHQRGGIEQRIFDGLQRLIAVRKTLPAFADFNNRELIDVGNEHLFVVMRTPVETRDEAVLIVANFDRQAQHLALADLSNRGSFALGALKDAVSGRSPEVQDNQLVIPAYGCYWLMAAP
jgi:amylosucrase